MDEKDFDRKSDTPSPEPRNEGGKIGFFQRRRNARAAQIESVRQRVAGPGVTLADFAHIDEKKVLRKMDLRLIPMLALLYLLSFLDRGNIANARIEGLVEDLNMTPGQYNWCLTAFFFTYSAFEVPSNIILKRWRPSVWMPFIMVAWGLVMTLFGIVQNYHGLLIARIFLGIAEAGLFPGVAFYITNWYCRHEAQLRQAMFFSAASVAGAFSGLLAFGIAHMDGVGGLEGWRWIFILEGILTVLVAFIAFFTLHDYPETAGFLTEDEKAFVAYRLKYQGNVRSQDSAQVGQADEFKWEYVKAAFLDWQIWVNIWVYWGIVAPLYSISLFVPTIIRDLGFSKAQAQLLTIPIYISASVAAVAVAYFSDRAGKRSPFIGSLYVVMAVGFIMCISTMSPGVTYAGVFIATIGIYPAFPGNITWLSNNLAGSTKRAVGQAIQISCGNLAGAMASNFYRSKDSPRYILGHALSLGFIGAGAIALTTLVLNYTRINKKREKQMAEGAHNGYTPEELSALGDRAITFRYFL